MSKIWVLGAFSWKLVVKKFLNFYMTVLFRQLGVPFEFGAIFRRYLSVELTRGLNRDEALIWSFYMKIC